MCSSQAPEAHKPFEANESRCIEMGVEREKRQLERERGIV